MTLRTLLVKLCLLAAFAAAPGCTPDNAVAPPPADLVGSWTWLSSTGGIGGITRTPETAGYTERIVFRADGRFEEYRNDTLRAVAGYSVARESTMFHPGTGEVIHYTDGRIAQELTRAGSDSLLLADRCIDCFFHVYRRIHP
jgi:hypothetical protein